jgi:hypothetical protein
VRAIAVLRNLVCCNAIPLAAVLLSAVLAALKMEGVLHWRWRHVLLPIWGPPVIVVVGWLTLVILARLFCLFQDRLLEPPARVESASASPDTPG